MSKFKYELKGITPRPHQVEAAKMIFNNFKKNQGCALFFEPGTGKTLAAFMGVVAYTKKFLNNGKTLIVTLPFLKEDFAYKAKEYCPNIKVCIINSTINKEKVKFVEASKDNPLEPCIPERTTSSLRKAMIIRDGKDFKLNVVHNSLDFPFSTSGDDPGESDLFIISYNLLHQIIQPQEGCEVNTNRITKKQYTSVFKGLKKFFPYDCIVADESQKAKDPTSKATNALLDISVGVPAVVMTGTPVGNGLQDLWSQYKISKIKNVDDTFISFIKRNFVMGGFKNRQIIAPKKDKVGFIRTLGKESAQVMTILTKDVTNIPEELETIYTFELSEEWRKLYDSYASEMCLSLDGYDTIEDSTELSMKLYLQAFSSGMITQKESYDFDKKELGKNKFQQVNFDKINELKFLIEGIPDEKRCIIWYRFTESRHSIEKLLVELGIKFESLYGQMKETVTEKVSRWRKNNDYKILLAQLSINAGYDANEATVNIYYESSFSFLDDKQTRGRTQRIGQTNRVEYIYMVAKNTIDEDIQKKLSKKRKTSHDLFAAHKKGDVLNIFEVLKTKEIKIKKTRKGEE